MKSLDRVRPDRRLRPVLPEILDRERPTGYMSKRPFHSNKLNLDLMKLLIFVFFLVFAILHSMLHLKKTLTLCIRALQRSQHYLDPYRELPRKKAPPLPANPIAI